MITLNKESRCASRLNRFRKCTSAGNSEIVRQPMPPNSIINNTDNKYVCKTNARRKFKSYSVRTKEINKESIDNDMNSLNNK